MSDNAYLTQKGSRLKRAAHRRVDSQINAAARCYKFAPALGKALLIPGPRTEVDPHAGTLRDIKRAWPSAKFKSFDIVEKDEDVFYGRGLNSNRIDRDFKRACKEVGYENASVTAHLKNVVDVMEETSKKYDYADLDICGTAFHKSGSISFAEALAGFVENNLQPRAVLQGTVQLNGIHHSRMETEEALREALSARSGFVFRDHYRSDKEKQSPHCGYYRFGLATWPEGDKTVLVEPSERSHLTATDREQATLLESLHETCEGRFHLDEMFKKLGVRYMSNHNLKAAVENYLKSKNSWHTGKRSEVNEAQKDCRELEFLFESVESCEYEPVITDVGDRVPMPNAPTRNELTELSSSESAGSMSYA